MKNERLRKAVNYLKMENEITHDKDVAVKMCSTVQNVSKALSGDKKVITDRFLRRFNEAFDEVFNIDWLLTGEGEMLKEAGEQTPPEGYTTKLLPTLARGGTLGDFSAAVHEYECEDIVTPIKGVDFAITVTGDSMAPEYPSGAKILIKRINEKAFIDWGRVYVLDTVNGTVVKKIMPGKSEKSVRCVSVNPDYPDFEVRFSDMLGMYRVLMMLVEK